MLTLRLNEQPLKYSLWQSSSIENYIDSEGEEVTLIFDGEEITMQEGEQTVVYATPVDFNANISPMGSKEAEAVTYGIDTTSYDAVIVTTKDKLPFDEKTVIWVDSEIEYDDDNNPNPMSSDYIVARVNKTLNVDRYLLRKTNRQDVIADD